MKTLYFWSRRYTAGLQIKDETGGVKTIRRGGSWASGCRWPREVAAVIGAAYDYQPRQRFDVPDDVAENAIAAATASYRKKSKKA